MKELGKYAFPNTKIRGRSSFLLNKEDLEKLVGFEIFEQTIDYLNHTSYRDIIKLIHPNYTLAQIEKVFIENDINVFKNIIFCFQSKAEHDFTFTLLQSYEIAELKKTFHYWQKKTSVNDAIPNTISSICFNIPTKEILKAKDIDKIVDLLSLTPYAKAIKQAKNDFLTKNSLFYIELSLDKDYYERLRIRIKDLSKLDEKISKKIIGLETDIENIKRILQLYDFYHFEKDKIKGYLLPHGNFINNSLLNKLDSSNNTNKLITKTYKDFPFFNSENVTTIEKFLWQLIFNQAKKAYREFPFSIGTFLGFFILKKIETQNILMILRAKKEKISNDILKGALCY